MLVVCIIFIVYAIPTFTNIADMLTPLLEESAPRFVESLFATISQKQAALKTKKRSAVKVSCIS